MMNILTTDSGVGRRGFWYQISRRPCCLFSVLSNSVGVQWLNSLTVSFFRSIRAHCFEAAAVSGDINNCLPNLTHC